jgi:hypothetical protein
MESLIVPSSIQRIRSFLVEMCGMKVKPWASTEETLAALHATLVARHGCDIFWTSLRVLLETLARDLKTRQEAAPGTLVDNEVLDGERYATLLDEIRASLAQQTADPPSATFRRLASSLSAPALALLLLLGGAASVGCDQTTLHSTPDAATQDLADARDTATQDLADAIKSQPDTKADSFVITPTRHTHSVRRERHVECRNQRSRWGHRHHPGHHAKLQHLQRGSGNGPRLSLTNARLLDRGIDFEACGCGLRRRDQPTELFYL